MRLGTVIELVETGQLAVLLSMARAVRVYYRVPFLASCIENGVLALLRGGPVPIERIAASLALPPGSQAGLRAWLEFGVRLGELRQSPAGFALRSQLARRLAAPENDAAAAFVVEAARLHARYVTDTPARLRAGRPFTLADQDGRLVARSSRLLEPFVREAIDAVVPAHGPVRLLDIGCGSGTYLRHAAERNPELHALGLELQADVAAFARENLVRWNLAGRVTIEVGDVRDRTPAPAFDVVLLLNNVNYFPVADRVAVLRHVRGFLRAGGRLLVTIGCAGSAAVDILNLWGAMTAGCGALPSPDELAAHLEAAGFSAVRRRGLIPGYGYFAFCGSVEARAAGP